MKFISKAIPSPSEGLDFSNEVSVVVPDQSMSLEEILRRFTRGEPLDVDMGGEYGEDDIDNPLNVDLEKLKTADLTEKAEYQERLNEVKTKYEKQEAEKSAKAKKAAFEKAEKAKAEAIEAEVQKRLKDGKQSA